MAKAHEYAQKASNGTLESETLFDRIKSALEDFKQKGDSK